MLVMLLSSQQLTMEPAFVKRIKRCIALDGTITWVPVTMPTNTRLKELIWAVMFGVCSAGLVLKVPLRSGRTVASGHGVKTATVNWASVVRQNTSAQSE